MKQLVLALMFLLSFSLAFGESVSAAIQIDDVLPSSGKVFIAVYNSAEAYKSKKPIKTYIVDSTSKTLLVTEELEKGEYLVIAFQDLNNNRKLDLNVLGIPNEPFGISNYDGKSIPGGFDKLKADIGPSNSHIDIRLVRLFRKD